MILGQATAENSERPHMQCVYKIKNLKDGTVYIGSTKDFSKRYGQHRRDLKNGRHRSRAMQLAFNRGDKLDMTVIEDCTGLSTDELLQHEQAQIVKYGSIENGYNTAVAWHGDLPQALCMSPADSLRQQLEGVTADRDTLLDQLRQLQADHAEQLDRLRREVENSQWWADYYKKCYESEREGYRLQRETTRKLENALIEKQIADQAQQLQRLRQIRQPQRKPTLWERIFRKGA